MVKKTKEKKVYIAISGDIIDANQIDLIQKASGYGQLIVGILTDQAISSYKRMPYMSFEDRFKIVKNIKNVAQVVTQNERDYKNNLNRYKPDYVLHYKNKWSEGIQKQIRNNIIKVLKKWNGKLIEVPIKKIFQNVESDKIHSLLSGPEIRSARLKRLISANSIVRVMETHSPLSALIVENIKYEKNFEIKEFDAFWSSSLTDSTLRGKPDIEAVDLTSRMQTINDIFDVTTKPLIYDADTGGKSEHFIYTIQSLERVGVSAVIIEDKKGLKRNSLYGNKVHQTQETIKIFSDKIYKARKKVQSNDFMLIARIESLILEKKVNDAISRAKSYISAGADAIMIHSKNKDINEIEEFCNKYHQVGLKAPLVVVPTSYNSVKEKYLEKLGIKVVIYANHMLRASVPMMQKVALDILKNERSKESDGDLMSINEILNYIPYTD